MTVRSVLLWLLPLALVGPVVHGHTTSGYVPLTSPNYADAWSSGSTATPCERWYTNSVGVGAGGGNPMPLHYDDPMLGTVYMGDFDLKSALGYEEARSDDFAGGGCGSHWEWLTVVRTAEGIRSLGPLSSNGFPVTIDLWWYPISVHHYHMATGAPVTGSCTLLATSPPLPATSTTVPVDPVTGECITSLTVPPAPLAVEFILHTDAQADGEAMGPLVSAAGFGIYLKTQFRAYGPGGAEDGADHCFDVYTPLSC